MPAAPRRVPSQVAAKPVVKPADESLQLCKAFAACEAADVLVMDSLACCRVCSRHIMWRVELCPACRGTFTGYAFYHMQGAYKAVHNGQLTLFFGYFIEEVWVLLMFLPRHTLLLSVHASAVECCVDAYNQIQQTMLLLSSCLLASGQGISFMSLV